MNKKKHCEFKFQFRKLYDLLNFTVIFSVIYANTTNSGLHFTYSLHLLQLEVERCKLKRKIRDTCCNKLAAACSYISKSEAVSSARYLIRKDSQDGSQNSKGYTLICRRDMKHKTYSPSHAGQGPYNGHLEAEEEIYFLACNTGMDKHYLMLEQEIFFYCDMQDMCKTKINLCSP